jgi:hydrogenase nickel incorporation protein HypA/HybF
MHEYSIVQALLEQCEELATQNDATQVEKLIIKVGVLSGVEIQLLQTAFDTFKEHTICHDAELIIEEEPIKIKCNNCDSQHTLSENRFTCPSCDSTNIDVIAGEEMYLMQLKMK